MSADRVGGEAGDPMATLASVRGQQNVSTASRAFARAAVVVGTATIGAVLVVPAATASGSVVDGGGTDQGLTFVQTVLLYVAAPAVIFALIVLLVVGPSLGKGPRHRTGAALETGPIWVDPAGVQGGPADTVIPVGPGSARQVRTEPRVTEPTDQGGASARW